MSTVKLYFATNRAHYGEDRWHPDGYGKGFSSNGHHNLRFGYVVLEYDENTVKKHLNETAHGRKGDGENLSKHFTKQSKKAKITAFKDRSLEVDRKLDFEETASTEAFREIKVEMEKAKDVVIFIHGYNVDWNKAVGSALSLQFMLNRKSNTNAESKDVIVVLFSWPSDGSMMPFAAYWSDRADAEASGMSIGRGFLTVSNFLRKLRKQVDPKEHKADPKKHKKVPQEDVLCDQNIHLLCHSMGNYALQNALSKIVEESPGIKLPRMFRHIFLCAPDIDDSVLEPGQPMDRLHELCLNVSVYFNSGDVGLGIADLTKGHPDRLGQTGMSREGHVHRKVHEVDCSIIVGGLAEHSYYLWATVNQDIRQSIDGLPFSDASRKRDKGERNSWVMR